MQLIITGGTGFIGAPLVQSLVAAGHTCVVLTRRPRPARLGIRYVTWDAGDINGGDPLSLAVPRRGAAASDASEWERAVDGADAVINLCGESVFERRWSTAQKQRLYDSRIRATQALVAAIGRATRKPAVLINGSAVGYYGEPVEIAADEDSPAGNTFLAHIARDWEAAALAAEAQGLRVVCLRIGVVFGPHGGPLARMLLPFRLGLGGRLGDGQQWISWIHVADVIGLIHFALTSEHVQGALNAVAPSPIRNMELTRTLGQLLHRPTLLSLPAWLLRLILGERASLLLASQRAHPTRTQAWGYEFRYPTLEGALRACLARRK